MKKLETNLTEIYIDFRQYQGHLGKVVKWGDDSEYFQNFMKRHSEQEITIEIIENCLEKLNQSLSSYCYAICCYGKGDVRGCDLNINKSLKELKIANKYYKISEIYGDETEEILGRLEDKLTGILNELNMDAN